MVSLGDSGKNLRSYCREDDPELDFKTVQPEAVGLDPTECFRSSPSGDEFLRHFIQSLNITDQDSILDIGCGKGSAMCIMREFPFARIMGVEISEQLAEIAKHNFETLHSKRCIVHVGNAARFSLYNLFNYYYLYNPFPCHVMTQVITKINQTTAMSSRERFIIYNNPVCHDEIIKGGWFKVKEVPTKWSLRIFIYSNRSPK
jgi:SAM-dependent methyltransferase